MAETAFCRPPPDEAESQNEKFLAPQLTQRRNHSLHSYSGAVCKTDHNAGSDPGMELLK